MSDGKHTSSAYITRNPIKHAFLKVTVKVNKKTQMQSLVHDYTFATCNIGINIQAHAQLTGLYENACNDVKTSVLLDRVDLCSRLCLP